MGRGNVAWTKDCKSFQISNTLANKPLIMPKHKLGNIITIYINRSKRDELDEASLE